MPTKKWRRIGTAIPFVRVSSTPLNDCKSSVDTVTDLYDFMRLAANAYAVSNSTLMIDICQRRPTLNNFFAMHSKIRYVLSRIDSSILSRYSQCSVSKGILSVYYHGPQSSLRITCRSRARLVDGSANRILPRDDPNYSRTVHSEIWRRDPRLYQPEV